MEWLRSRKVLSLWRPEVMELVQLWISSDSAREVMKELGEKEIIELRDLNTELSAFQRHYVNYEKRCDSLERILRYLGSQIEKCENEKGHEIAYSRGEGFDESLVDLSDAKNLADMEEMLEGYEREVAELMDQRKKLLDNKLKFEELLVVLDKASYFYRSEASATKSVSVKDEERTELLDSAPPGQDEISDDSEASAGLDETNTTLQAGGYQPLLKIINISGVIPYSRYLSFERVVWRVTRGNIFIRRSELADEEGDGSGKRRVVFIIFFAGENTKAKLQKICDAFNVNKYPCPDTEEERESIRNEVQVRMTDVDIVLDNNMRQLDQILSAVCVNFTMWVKKVRTEKLIYNELNKCNVNTSSRAVIAEGWVQKSRLKELEGIVAEHSSADTSMVTTIKSHKFTPPTHIQTNKYTESFLGIVHAYGIANYREVSPSCFTIITFPFLFAVMFGDAGHGALMSLFAFFLIFMEKKYEGKTLNEFMQFAYDGRYPLLLMGLFSTYVGLCYNETFSMSFDLFGTNYYYPNGSDPQNGGAWIIDPNRVYPFGVDPAWKGTEGELLYYNSLKMKLSVILGVTQMILGVFLSLINHIYEFNIVNIVMEFIPEVIFIHSIFGYLVFLIFFKWGIKWNPGEDDPRLLNTLIFMFLSPFSVDPPLFKYQAYVQNVLVILALISVPWLLLGKPVTITIMRIWKMFKKSQRKKAKKLRDAQRIAVGGDTEADVSALIQGNDDIDAPGDEEGVPQAEGEAEHEVPEVPMAAEDGVVPVGEQSVEESMMADLMADDEEEEEEEEEEMSLVEIYLEQCIHTLEYVIGCVSNTASYLRLWALSLAHTELSTVFYERILLLTLNISNVYFPLFFWAPVLGFIVWAGATFAILLCMETLSAMLHALRLHWVEYQNKFYGGEGYLFIPFSLRELLPKEKDE